MSRRLWDFPGGVHPPGNKVQSSETSIQPMPLPPELVLPLSQNFGQAPKPLVTVGQTVHKGQPLALASGAFSIPVHAPTSGTITAIEPRPTQHPSQIHELCIILQPDQQEQWAELEPLAQWQQAPREALLQTIGRAGIAGLGGAGFPTLVKLSAKPETIQQLIINGVECEPYITADDRLMRERAQGIVSGVEIMAQLTAPEQVLVAIEDNKPQAIKAMSQAMRGKNMELVVVPTKYPSGGEKQLIFMLTGKEVKTGGIPADVGVLCQNVGTAFAVHRAVEFGEPLISRIVTLTGNGIPKKGNYEVLVGTPIKWLLEQTQAKPEQVDRIVIGGPMMGFSAHDQQIPVTKTTNCVLVPSDQELADPKLEQPCIRCGSCAQVCPAQLLPQQLYWFSKAKEFDKAEHYNLNDCIECGACAYVCPSQIPLVQYYRFAKGSIKEHKLHTQKSDLARTRFEARQARLEREEREKEQKRAARAEAAAAKAAAKKKAAAQPSAPLDDDQQRLAKLQVAVAATEKRFKDASSALAKAEKNGAENIEQLRQKVATLETKAQAAKTALAQAKLTDSAADKPTPTSEEPS